MSRKEASKIVTLSRSKDYEKMVEKLLSDDFSLQLEASTKFKEILSSERNPPINKVTQSVVVPRFIEFLEKKDSPKLQYEAVCVLTNIAYENAKVVIEHGAVPILVKHLASPPNEYLLEQAIWALGNVAGHSVENRDYVLNCGALIPLLPQLHMKTRSSIRRIATWTLANLFRDQPLLPLDQVKYALAALEHVLRTDDEELLTNACWALFYLSNGSQDGIQSVIEAGFVPILIQLLKHTSLIVVFPAIRIIGNIVAGDIQQTQCVIDSGALSNLANILTQDIDENIKMEACWTISNITAGTEEQIQLVINENLIPTLVNLAQNAEFSIKKEALWAISNATSAGSHDQIKYLVEQSCIKPLCDNLVSENLKLVLGCLKGLENILKMGEAENNIRDYRQMISDAEGQEKIENLQCYEDSDICLKAFKIMETYWLEEEDDETQLQPSR